MLESAQQLPDSILDRQRQELRDGRRPTIESFLAATPFDGDREAELDLLYNEVVVLEELGEHPEFADYARRYPHLEQDLRLHFEIHRAVSGDLLEATNHSLGPDTWPDPDEDSFAPGTMLGDYELTQQIGRGGMGVVYRAHDHRLHRDVALKLFQPGRQPTPREAQRFQTEAESMARLAHPNIVRIFEVGRIDGRPFLALELAERGTLAQQLQVTVLEPRRAAALIETLARAVQHAHDHQVIHRDLKPANILFDREGTPKITDFGLAKVLHDDLQSPRDATRTGEPIGTPRYMAPEQASGQNDTIGPATDVYALGTLLYECLTGQAPFVATSVVDTLQKIRMDDPVSPSRLQPSIPRDLATICLHSLQKEPARRYPTALALATDLGRYQRGEPIHARPTPAWERAWKWSRRRPALATLVAVAVAASFAAVALYAVGKKAETQRVNRLRADIAELVREGRSLLDEGESNLAHGRFQEAWMKVQAEPALADHQPGIGGWLDHSRRAVNQEQWTQRVPPREFDELRDVAFLESMLLEPHADEPISAARESIRAALELTIAADPAWQTERERLTLVEAELISRDVSASAALAYLDATREFSSRPFHEARAGYLNRLGRGEFAEQASQLAASFPVDRSEQLLKRGMDQIRQRDFAAALSSLQELLNAEPAHFSARLFQAICFLNLRRPGEARVALTACIAQRPRLYWNYFYRSQAELAMGDLRSAIEDLQRVLAMKPADPVRRAADDLLKTARVSSASPPPATSSAP